MEGYNKRAAILRSHGVDIDDLQDGWYWTLMRSTLESEKKTTFIKVQMTGASMPNFKGYPYYCRPVRL